MEVTIGGDAAKSGKNIHLLVIMRVGILHEIGLQNLIDQTQLKKNS